MTLRNTSERYGWVSQLFHWIIVALIITQYVLAAMADGAPLFQQLVTIARHKSFGMLILMLAVLRLLWRWTNPVPPPVAGTPAWQRTSAHASHFILYALLFLQPLTGWLMSSARGFSVSFFNLFTFPDFIAADPARYEQLHEIHEVLAATLLIVAAVHAAAALKHHFYDRDDVLRRMLPLSLRNRN